MGKKINRQDAMMKKITLCISAIAALELFGSSTMPLITEYVPYINEATPKMSVRADVKSSALAYLNKLRAEAGMTIYVQNSTLESAAQNHANYLYANNSTGHYETAGLQGFTGVAPVDRVKYAGYKSSAGENVSYSFGQVDDEYGSIDGLMGAIYHRFGFLDFSYDSLGVGYVLNAQLSHFVYNMGNSKMEAVCSGNSFSGSGGYITGACSDENKKISSSAYDAARFANKAANPDIVLFPPESGSPTPPVFFEESPDPLPDYSVSGYPISVQFNDYRYGTVLLNHFKLYDSSGNEITNTRLLDKNSDPNGRFDTYQYVLFPLERLDFGKKYSVKTSFTADGKKIEKNWSFTTREPSYPYYEAKSGDTLYIKSGTKYAIYVKPKNGTDVNSGYGMSYLGYITIDEKGFYDQNTVYIKATETQKDERNHVNISLSNGSTIKLVFKETDTATYPGAQGSSSSALSSAASQSANVLIKNGWNLISLPVDTTLSSSNYLATFGGYSTIYKYSSSGGWVSDPSSISKGEGFWINSSETSKTASFSGNPYTTNIDSLGSGWHLLGAGEKITNPHLKNGVTVVWKYSNPSGWSMNPSEISAGEGFWVLK